MLQSYEAIENQVFKAIVITDTNIKVNHNARAGKFVYDLVIVNRILEHERLHKVCEIKYYQKEIFYAYVQHGISSFLLAASNYERYISTDDRRVRIEYYMIWICTNQEQKKRLESYKVRAP